MDTNGRRFSYSLHLLNDTIQSHARTSYFTAPFTLMFFSFLCMQLIKLCNHEIMNHNPIIYLIECASCVLVYLCFGGRLCSLIQSASNHLLVPSVNEWETALMHLKSVKT